VLANLYSFNPRARDGRERVSTICRSLDQSFNPRARDGREGRAAYINEGFLVSIHAPVMDANNLEHEISKATYVSIHAPVMDAN
tara:strand:+ start:5596 stop:5847 length:252 start_codon:yes stop_codon:yes gene_type:complete